MQRKSEIQILSLTNLKQKCVPFTFALISERRTREVQVGNGAPNVINVAYKKFFHTLFNTPMCTRFITRHVRRRMLHSTLGKTSVFEILAPEKLKFRRIDLT